MKKDHKKEDQRFENENQKIALKRKKTTRMQPAANLRRSAPVIVRLAILYLPKNQEKIFTKRGTDDRSAAQPPQEIGQK